MEVGNNSNFVGDNKLMFASGGAVLTVSLAVSGVAIALIFTQGTAMLGLIILGGTAGSDVVLMAIGSVAICRKKKTIEDEPEEDRLDDNQIEETPDPLEGLNQVMEDLDELERGQEAVEVNSRPESRLEEEPVEEVVIEEGALSEVESESEPEVDVLEDLRRELSLLCLPQEDLSIEHLQATADRLEEIQMIIELEEEARSFDLIEEEEIEIGELGEFINLDDLGIFLQQEASERDAAVEERSSSKAEEDEANSAEEESDSDLLEEFEESKIESATTLATDEIAPAKTDETEEVETITFDELKEMKNRGLRSSEKMISALLTCDANFRDKRKGYINDREKKFHALMEDLIFLTDNQKLFNAIRRGLEQSGPQALEEKADLESIPGSQSSFLDLALESTKEVCVKGMSTLASHKAHLARDQKGYEGCTLCSTEGGRVFADLVDGMDTDKFEEKIALLYAHLTHLSAGQKSNDDCRICTDDDYEDLRDHIEKIKPVDLEKKIAGLAEPSHQAHLCELCSTSEGRNLRDYFEHLKGEDFEGKIEVLRKDYSTVEDLEGRIDLLRAHEADHCKLCSTKKGREMRDHVEKMSKMVNKVPVPMFVAKTAVKALVKLVLALGKDEDNGALIKLVKKIDVLNTALDEAKNEPQVVAFVTAINADPQVPKIIYKVICRALDLVEPFLLDGYLKKGNFRGFLSDLLVVHGDSIIEQLDVCLKAEDYEAKMKGVENLAEFVAAKLIPSAADIKKKR